MTRVSLMPPSCTVRPDASPMGPNLAIMVSCRTRAHVLYALEVQTFRLREFDDPVTYGPAGFTPARCKMRSSAGSGIAIALAAGAGLGLRGFLGPAPPPRPR